MKERSPWDALLRGLVNCLLLHITCERAPKTRRHMPRCLRCAPVPSVSKIGGWTDASCMLLLSRVQCVLPQWLLRGYSGWSSQRTISTMEQWAAMAICLRGLSLDMLRRWFLVCCALMPRLSCNSSLHVSGPNGEVAERLKAPASKAGDGVPSFVGSNPTLSASIAQMLELSSAHTVLDAGVQP
jgi:hypothetical protein